MYCMANYMWLNAIFVTHKSMWFIKKIDRAVFLIFLFLIIKKLTQ
jgi:hypothetical protein